MRTVALILAAGRGERLGAGQPKGLIALAGRSLFEWSAAALGQAAGVDAVLPVLPAGCLAAAQALDRVWTGPARLLEAVEGGARRQDSVEHGLAAARGRLPELSWVLVHDAARCLVAPRDAEAALAAARATGAALPVVPPADTVKLLDGDRVRRTLERDQLGLALTPQAFRAEILAEALDKARRDGFTGTDCASLVERLGVEVRVFPGRPGNWKVTHAADLERAAAALAGGGRGA
jgi:2-C-methyl-D-erythritol 4-phosphate cytidylyltransferase